MSTLESLLPLRFTLRNEDLTDDFVTDRGTFIEAYKTQQWNTRIGPLRFDFFFELEKGLITTLVKRGLIVMYHCS